MAPFSSTIPHVLQRGRRTARLLLTLAAIGLGLGVGPVMAAQPHTTTPVYGYKIVNTYPHDPHAFSQGLVFVDGQLYEGTGQYGQSTLRKVDLETGRVLQQVALERWLFGEGITVWDNRIIQLTWRAGIGIVYNRESFKEIRRFQVRGEGWGLTHDGAHLILSNGSSTLQFLDPKTFKVVRRIGVRDGGKWIRNLNELEYAEGVILANVWGENRIAWISPQTGNVAAWIDLEGLAPREVRSDRDAVLNGIAYDAKMKRLFVTGKNWPKLYEIQLTK